ncbi:hypothetical protein UPYG_G00005540 [Umbra pygmaea]|uniref:Immunoglobulin V-set domain-containing protein n=1 Tax=Umbra pygmaea TaxID=75934 RepID=A0ABD0XJU7_UMBPY
MGLKMKIIILLLSVLEICRVQGQERTHVYAQIHGYVLMRFIFPPYYNPHEKLCFKLIQWEFIAVLSNRGYVSNLLKGRVSKTEYNGLMEIRIWNLQQADAGEFRCVVMGTQLHIYHDFHLDMNSGEWRHAFPPLPPVNVTVRPSTVSLSFSPDISGPVVSKDHHDNRSVSWHLGEWLLTGLCISTLILISFVIIAVVHRRAKNKCGATCSESVDHIVSCVPQEDDIVVYTTVDFKPPVIPTTELYANLQTIHSSSPRRGHDPETERENAGTVVYSIVAGIPC